MGVSDSEGHVWSLLQAADVCNVDNITAVPALQGEECFALTPQECTSSRPDLQGSSPMSGRHDTWQLDEGSPTELSALSRPPDGHDATAAEGGIAGVPETLPEGLRRVNDPGKRPIASEDVTRRGIEASARAQND